MDEALNLIMPYVAPSHGRVGWNPTAPSNVSTLVGRALSWACGLERP